jgi:hypothetical protein
MVPSLRALRLRGVPMVQVIQSPLKWMWSGWDAPVRYLARCMRCVGYRGKICRVASPEVAVRKIPNPLPRAHIYWLVSGPRSTV